MLNYKQADERVNERMDKLIPECHHRTPNSLSVYDKEPVLFGSGTATGKMAKLYNE